MGTTFLASMAGLAADAVATASASAGSAGDSQVLTALVLIPAVGALAVVLLPARRAELHKPVAVLFSALTGGLVLYLLAAFDTGEAGQQLGVKWVWVEDFGIAWNLGVDGISLFLVALTGLLFPIALLASNPHHDSKPYFAWLLLLQAGCVGVFLALDLFLFFLFFEVVLVPMYFLIGGWGYGRRVYAALKFFLFTMAGSALMLVAIVSLVFLHRSALEDRAQDEATETAAAAQAQFEELVAQIQENETELTPELNEQLTRLQEEAQSLGSAEVDIAPTFDLQEIAEARTVVDDSSGSSPFDWSAARWIFLAFALAFAVKVPLFPVHTWLPDAHTEAPTAGSVILAGVLLKLGTYGLLRFGLYLLPDAATFFGPTLVTLGVVGILYGAVVATMQKDLKRLVAYSSVAHLGFIVLGTFAVTTQGIEGGLLQNINHGLSTGALFLLVGMIMDRRHTREISALRGLQKVAPVFAVVFTVVMMSSIGLPGLNGFVGEFLILVGSFVTLRWWAVVAAVGVVLAALYLLWAYQRVFQGAPDDENKGFAEMTWSEGLLMAPLLGLIVFLGLYPKPVLERMEPSVDRLIAHVEEYRDGASGDTDVAADEDEEVNDVDEVKVEDREGAGAMGVEADDDDAAADAEVGQ